MRGDFQITMEEDLHSLSQSLVAEYHHRIHARGSQGRNETRHESRDGDDRDDTGERQRIAGADVRELAHEDTRGREAGGQANRYPGGEPPHAHSERQTQNVATASAHGQTDADLAVCRAMV